MPNPEKKLWRHFFFTGALSTLSACSTINSDGPPLHPMDVSAIPDASPKIEPISRGGNPKSYQVNGKIYKVKTSSHGYVATGIASWYGTKFHGRKTSNGETYDMYAMTAAHTTLPIPTYVQVKNLENDRKIVVRINDRGPFHDDRIIDLSYAAALKLHMTDKGTVPVEIRAINPATTGTRQDRILSNRAINEFNLSSTQKSNNARYFLQMGAFSKRRNAEQLASSLAKHTDVTVRISDIQTDDGIMYRVRLGPFTDRRQMEIIETQLGRIGFIETHSIFEP